MGGTEGISGGAFPGYSGVSFGKRVEIMRGYGVWLFLREMEKGVCAVLDVRKWVFNLRRGVVLFMTMREDEINAVIDDVMLDLCFPSEYYDYDYENWNVNWGGVLCWGL